MDISIIVCTYNRCSSLGDTLQALKKQQFSKDISVELIIVDNNSKDKTREVVEKEIVNSPFPVRYVFEPEQGICAARNCAIKESKGDLIIFTDDDVIPRENWVQAFWDGYQQYNADCMGGRIDLLWLADPPKWLLNNSVFLGHLGVLDHGSNHVVSDNFNANLIYGSNMAFRRSCFDELGVFLNGLGVKGKKLIRGEETEMVERFISFRLVKI